MLKLGTFCSGIGAPEVATRGMFEPIWFSEIEPFPCAVLAHHWPTVPNLGDMTASDLVERIAGIGLPDVVVAGLPCQPFSVAGLRKGEADPRNLTARFVEIADAIDDLRRDAGKPPVWWLVENVPGLLSDRGNAFGAILGGMVGSNSAIVPNGRWECAGVATGPRRSAAWRVLDAQFFGVAQRRRRVFALFVADSGSLKCADALLPVIDSLSWNPPPRREAGQDVAASLTASLGRRGGQPSGGDIEGHLIPSTGSVAHCLNAGGMGRIDYETETMVAHTLRGEGFDASEDGTGRGTPLVPVAIQERAVSENPDAGPQGAGFRQDGVAYTLEARNKVQAVAFAQNQRGELRTSDISPQLTTGGGKPGEGYPAVMEPIAFDCKGTEVQTVDDGTHPTLRSMGHNQSHQNAGGHAAVAFDLRGRDGGAMPEGPHDTANLRAASGGSSRSYIAQPWAVRRLTPTECARLQGFPDDHTRIPWRGKPAEDCPDGPQYKAYGNSMAVPVIRWIMDRIRISREQQAAAMADQWGGYALEQENVK